jgi:hypothetical protein
LQYMLEEGPELLIKYSSLVLLSSN